MAPDSRRSQKPKDLAPIKPVEALIRVVRGWNVFLDADLAALYEVPTKRLNEAVNRNLERFPKNFMFRFFSRGSDGSKVASVIEILLHAQ